MRVVSLIDAAHVGRHIFPVRGAGDQEHDCRDDEHAEHHDDHGRQFAHREHLGRLAKQREHDRVDDLPSQLRKQQAEQDHDRTQDVHREILALAGQVFFRVARLMHGDELTQPLGPVKHRRRAAEGDEDDEDDIAGIHE